MNNKNYFLIDQNTIMIIREKITNAVQYAIDIFLRDLKKVGGFTLKVTQEIEENAQAIILKYATDNDDIAETAEQFKLSFISNKNNQDHLIITGADDLGIIYALLYISKHYLGVDPFWFWADREPQQKSKIAILKKEYISPQQKVRYRGWFVNDEVCLIGWTDQYPPPKEVWMPVFEALLRNGGNMVIPGTDLPRHGIHFDLALEIGLWITHHHAEPLGAEMFFRAYPNDEASYDKNSKLFDKLWLDAIKKHKNDKVIWVLGFRGQGDCPFWQQDPQYNTMEKRGQLISKIIKIQYQMVYDHVNNPVCSTYLYGEIAELYAGGYLDIPDNVIKIWSDNGYGKMVSRRQGNHNLRIKALPTENHSGLHGLYYHITFHDLQASSHLTMLGNSVKFISSELKEAFAAHADHFLLLNSGNIRPHIYTIGAVSQIWNNGSINVQQYNQDFTDRFFPSLPEKAVACYQEYFNTTIKYGNHSDDKAGEEFYHHTARSIIGHWMTGKQNQSLETLFWLTGENLSFSKQINFIKELCKNGILNWEKLNTKNQQILNQLDEIDKSFFKDNIDQQVKLHLTGCQGLFHLCQSFAYFEEKNHAYAFVFAAKSSWDYQKGLNALKDAEHDKWKNFYRADWLTNIKCTIYTLNALKNFLRMHGDSPDFFLWSKEYLLPVTEKKIYLENTQRETFSDDELALKLINKLKI